MLLWSIAEFENASYGDLENTFTIVLLINSIKDEIAAGCQSFFILISFLFFMYVVLKILHIIQSVKCIMNLVHKYVAWV